MSQYDPKAASVKRDNGKVGPSPPQQWTGVPSDDDDGAGGGDEDEEVTEGTVLEGGGVAVDEDADDADEMGSPPGSFRATMVMEKLLQAVSMIHPPCFIFVPVSHPLMTVLTSELQLPSENPPPSIWHPGALLLVRLACVSTPS